MENFKLDPGTKTPSIILEIAGYIEMKGKSIPENSAEFYEPVYQWLNRYMQSPPATTRVLLHFEYFNTSSSKCLLDIFRKLEMLHQSGKSIVSITWLFDEDDEDMMETGEDYQSMVQIPFIVQAEKH